MRIWNIFINRYALSIIIMTSKYSSIGEKVEDMLSLPEMNGKPDSSLALSIIVKKLAKILDVSDGGYYMSTRGVDIKVQLQDETLSELTLNVSYPGTSGAEEKIKPIKEHLPSHIDEEAYIFYSQRSIGCGYRPKTPQMIAPLESSQILVRGIERGAGFELHDLGCKVRDYAQQKMPLLNK